VHMALRRGPPIWHIQYDPTVCEKRGITRLMGEPIVTKI
jgi:hypothetical protein